MKKTVVCMLIAAMTMGSMVTPVFADGDGDATHIYVLTAPEDHGWTGSVATFAKEKIEEVNGDGTYSAELITSADAAEQIVNIEDIIAAGEDNIAVVIQPIDDTVQSAIQQLVDAEIPYVAFDRIIEGVADSAVSNVKGDNEGIGAACAAYYTSNPYRTRGLPIPAKRPRTAASSSPSGRQAPTPRKARRSRRSSGVNGSVSPVCTRRLAPPRSTHAR